MDEYLSDKQIKERFSKRERRNVKIGNIELKPEMVITIKVDREGYYHKYNGQPERILKAGQPCTIINPRLPYVRWHTNRLGNLTDEFCLVEFYCETTQHIERASVDYCDIVISDL